MNVHPFRHVAIERVILQWYAVHGNLLYPINFVLFGVGVWSEPLISVVQAIVENEKVNNMIVQAHDHKHIDMCSFFSWKTLELIHMYFLQYCREVQDPSLRAPNLPT